MRPLAADAGAGVRTSVGVSIEALQGRQPPTE